MIEFVKVAITNVVISKMKNDYRWMSSQCRSIYGLLFKSVLKLVMMVSLQVARIVKFYRVSNGSIVGLWLYWILKLRMLYYRQKEINLALEQCRMKS